ncbi:MAG: hypothetical protein GXN95_05010 [Methanococci archaeon]|nr:hypothetical protein [Methanococci archaeon]
MRKLIILLLLTFSFFGAIHAESLPYWIEDYGEGYNLWIKVPYIPANGIL